MHHKNKKEHFVGTCFSFKSPRHFITAKHCLPEDLGSVTVALPSLQKSIIASTISGARATLNEPSRPFTPGDLPRHLFAGNDYSERPGSAYKIGQVANDAIENFTRSSTAETNTKVQK